MHTTIRQPFSRAFVLRVLTTAPCSLPLAFHFHPWQPQTKTQNLVSCFVGLLPFLNNNLTCQFSSHAPKKLCFSKLHLSLLSMENALNQTNTLPTFQSKERKTYQKHLMGTALPVVHDSSLSTAFQRNRATRRKRREYLNKDNHHHLTEDEDEKVHVKRKIVALQRIVPGGESLGLDKLFEETAGYILALQCQIKVMRALTGLIERLEKQKSKVGG